MISTTICSINLDLETKKHLIQVLRECPGAIVIVWHEEDFLEAPDIDHICTINDGMLNF